MRTVLVGAAAGLVASSLMTLMRKVGEEAGTGSDTPPRQTAWAVERRGPPIVRRSSVTGKAAILHAAIGMAGGAVFGALPGRGAAPLLVGPAYGLGFYVVAIGLAGPSMGVLPPMHRQSRTFLVRELLTHLVFGTTVASSVALAEQRR